PPSSKPVIGPAMLREAGLPPHVQETGSELIFHRKKREVANGIQIPDAGSFCRCSWASIWPSVAVGDSGVPVGYLAWQASEEWE
ncbi:hypothetical protein HispidOSU_024831, partial [Sigmodon hispidus]